MEGAYGAARSMEHVLCDDGVEARELYGVGQLSGNQSVDAFGGAWLGATVQPDDDVGMR